MIARANLTIVEPPVVLDGEAAELAGAESAAACERLNAACDRIEESDVSRGD
jgi:hypothetical protein